MAFWGIKKSSDTYFLIVIFILYLYTVSKASASQSCFSCTSGLIDECTSALRLANWLTVYKASLIVRAAVDFFFFFFSYSLGFLKNPLSCSIFSNYMCTGHPRELLVFNSIIPLLSDSFVCAHRCTGSHLAKGSERQSQAVPVIKGLSV